MIYYAAAMIITMVMVTQNTTTYPLPDGAEARAFPNTRLAFAALLPLTFLALFRWDVGVDSIYAGRYWQYYQDAAENINSRELEPAFFLFMQVFSKLDIPYFWFLFAHSLLFMVSVSHAVSLGSIHTRWSVLVFFLLAIYFDAFSSLRQSLAEGISLIAWARMGYDPPSKRKDFCISALFLLAVLFHTTALINIPLFFLCRIRFSRGGLMKLTVLALLLTPALQALLRWIMDWLYGGKYEFMGFALINAVLTGILFALCWYFYDEIAALDENAHQYVNLSLGIFLLLLNSGALFLPYRVFDMLKIGYVFIVPYLLRGIRNARTRLYVEIGLLLIFGAWFVNYFYLQDSSAGDYQWVFGSFEVFTSLP